MPEAEEEYDDEHEGDEDDDGDPWQVAPLILVRDKNKKKAPTLWVFAIDPDTNQKSSRIDILPSEDLEEIEEHVAEEFGSGRFVLGLRNEKNKPVKKGTLRIRIPGHMAPPFVFESVEETGRRHRSGRGRGRSHYDDYDDEPRRRGGKHLTQADIDLAEIKAEMRYMRRAESSKPAETSMDKMLVMVMGKMFDNFGAEKSNKSDLALEGMRSGMGIMKEIQGERTAGDMQTEVVKQVGSLADKLADLVIELKTGGGKEGIKEVSAGAANVDDRTEAYNPPPKQQNGEKSEAVEPDEIIETDEETLKALGELLDKSLREKWQPARLVYDIVHNWGKKRFQSWLLEWDEIIDECADAYPPFKEEWMRDKVASRAWIVGLVNHIKAQKKKDGTG